MRAITCKNMMGNAASRGRAIDLDYDGMIAIMDRAASRPYRREDHPTLRPGIYADDATEYSVASLVYSTGVMYDLDGEDHKGLGVREDGSCWIDTEVVEIVKAAFPGIQFHWWQTGGSGMNALKMRVLIPLADPINPAQLRSVWVHGVSKLVGAGLNLDWVDQTSSERTRHHILPCGKGHGSIPGSPWTPEPDDVASPPPDDNRGSGSSDDGGSRRVVPAGTVIEFEDGTTIPVEEITPNIISRMQGVSTRNPRCKCPEGSSSCSAFARYFRGSLYITCTAKKHNHPPDCTFIAQASRAVGATIPDPWIRTQEGTLRKQINKDEIIHVCYHCPTVTRMMRDPDTGDAWIELTWLDRGRVSRSLMRRDEASSATGLRARAGRAGLDLNENNVKIMTGYISDAIAANDPPEALVTSRMGWHGQEGFLWGDTWISSGAPPREFVSPSGVDGAHHLCANLVSQGTFSGWCDALASLAQWPLALVSVVASCASAVVIPCGAAGFSTLYFSQNGTGKTVTVGLAQTVWGRYAGLQVGWNATVIGIEQLMAVYGSIPVFLDDTNERGKQRNAADIEAVLYAVYNGRGRLRGGPQGHRAVSAWGLNMVSTGEPAQRSTVRAGGANARSLFITRPPFGVDNKDRVSGLVRPLVANMSANCGHAGPAIVSMILGRGHAKIKARYEERRTYWFDRCRDHNTPDRLASYISMMDVAWSLLRAAARAGGIESLDGIDIETVLAEVIAENVEGDKVAGVSDPMARAAQEFYSWFVSNRSRFWSPGIDSPAGIRWLGRADGGSRWTCIYVSAVGLDEFISSQRYAFGSTSLAGEWAKMGVITPGKDRIQHKVCIGKSADWVYRFDRDRLEARGICPTMTEEDMHDE